MQTNDGRHRSGNAVAEVTPHGVAHHRVQLFNRVALRGDGVTQSSGDKAAIHLVLGNFKYDFAHRNILFQAAANSGESFNSMSFSAATGSNAYARPSRPANSTSNALPS